MAHHWMHCSGNKQRKMFTLPNEFDRFFILLLKLDHTKSHISALQISRDHKLKNLAFTNKGLEINQIQISKNL